MAQINNISGPDDKGNYQARLDDGTVVTYGPCKQPEYESRGYWFVSLGSNHDHTTFIIDMNRDDVVVREVSARGIDKDAWRLIARAIVYGAWNA